MTEPLPSSVELASALLAEWDHLTAAERRELHELIEAARSREEPTGLLDFIPRLSRGYTRPEHLAAVASLFERAFAGEPVFACVSVPPRHGKTEMVLAAIAWWLSRRPADTLGFVSYASSFAESKSSRGRDFATGQGVRLHASRNTLSEWRTTEGGGLLATGIGGPLTGQGVRLAVVDDPVKNREEAESALIRQRTWDWFTSTLWTRIEPGGSCIVVHTRWHEDDPPGRILAGKLAVGMGFEHVSLPFLGRRREDGTVEADDLGDVVLWPRQQLPDGTWVGWTVEDARDRLRAVGEYDAASIYQGRPRPRGGKVFHEPHRVEAPEFRGARISIGCDPAGTDGPNSNHTVLVALAHRDVVLTTASGEKRTARVSDVAGVMRLKLRPEHAAPRVLAFQRAFGVPLDIESTRDGKDLARALKKIEPALVIRDVQAIGDKFIRAQPPAADWNQGLIRVPLDTRGMRCTTEQDLLDFTRVVTGFTGVGGGEDDDVDALAHAHSRARGAGVTQFSR